MAGGIFRRMCLKDVSQGRPEVGGRQLLGRGGQARSRRLRARRAMVAARG